MEAERISMLQLTECVNLLVRLLFCALPFLDSLQTIQLGRMCEFTSERILLQVFWVHYK